MKLNSLLLLASRVYTSCKSLQWRSAAAHCYWSKFMLIRVGNILSLLVNCWVLTFVWICPTSSFLWPMSKWEVEVIRWGCTTGEMCFYRRYPHWVAGWWLSALQSWLAAPQAHCVSMAGSILPHAPTHLGCTLPPYSTAASQQGPVGWLHACREPYCSSLWRSTPKCC